MIGVIITVVATVVGFAVAIGVPTTLVILARRRRASELHNLEDLPGLDTKVSEGGPPDRDVAAALLDFVDEWSKTFGDRSRIVDAIDQLIIIWHPGASFEGSRGDPMAGETTSKSVVHVAEKGGAPIGGTALFHELVHVALWHLTGEPDPDHEHDRWPGWTEEHTALVRRLKARWR